MTVSRRQIINTMLALPMGASLISNHALAQNKNLNMIVPYPAGGASDFVARKLQPELSSKLGQTVVIDNVGGAGGSIGVMKALSAPSDGSSVILASPMELILTPLAIQGIRYKPEDLRLVAQLVGTSTILAVRPGLDVKNMEEFIGLARKSAAKPLSYGSVGPGSLYHLAGEKLAQLTNTKLLHVPYRGIANVIPDLIGGTIDFAFLPMAGTVMSTIADGKLRGIAITAKSPHPLFAQYPAMAAMPGLSDMEFGLWAGLVAHKSTPYSVADRLNKAAYDAMQNPTLRRDLEGTGNAILAPRTLGELDRIYAFEIKSYNAIAKSINLQSQPQ
jgi:tripartite-type tricarboxylate transporter receptor subunit TctC